ncbi:50S ribosomal protein L30 [candidate division KSB1 bacterium]|nr:MAG: 50S ribosomal protein L30 [candidate division KSB1 bacterium]
MAKKLRIQQIKSIIGRTEKQRKTIAALGLKRIRHTVEHKDTPQIRGMIEKVRHIIKVEEVD